MLARLKSRFLGPKPPPHIALRTSLLRREKLLTKLDHLLPFFWRLLILIGVGWLLALPWREEYTTNAGKRKYRGLGRGHYVSENALQPGQVSLAHEREGEELKLTRTEDRSTRIGIGRTCILLISTLRRWRSGL